ncbi:phage tail tape measure protein [Pseudoalteromonas undina]|uniref:phage tail tape measure protein n=1 Tax=Pseudoalteromonas undina TaxID=43660 RepID=UPI001869195F|nr:phage tail tape measure protein [Pseudoalteromonas undina]
MSLPQSLMFTVGMIDQITKPIAKISSSLNGLTNDYQAGTMKMASGVAGIAGAGFALQNALMPAIEMDRALGEVSSLGVRESALKQLTDTSYQFALKYGKSSTEFVKSSYDIQSAIAGLNDADLSAFTLSGNVLAAATKADAATITDYMGTMYGTFKNEAESMGKGEWVQQLTGMTATAVQVFKTDGKKMADAFKGMSGASKEALSDQMAILGTLQSTLGGGESATQYKAFLGGAAKAQEKLGMNFTDQYGKLLPTIEILEKLKGKYGDLTIASDRLEIKEAFGTDQALGFIDLLSKDTDALRVNMDALGKVKGMEQAEKMASAMTDQSERLSQSWYVIRAALGSAILPAFNDFVGMIADMGSGVLSFTEEFPTLTKWLGYAAVGVLGLVAAGGLISVVMGAATMAMTAWNTATMIGRGISAAWTASIAFLKGAMLALNIVMYANPILLIVAGIVAAIAAVGALIYYWDDLKATMGEWGWIKAIVGVFTSVWSTVKNLFTGYLNWWIDKINMLPGVDIELISSGSNASTSSIDAIEPIRSKAEKGGITQQISNANQQKSTSVGTVNVYPAKGETNFMNFVEMQS